LSDGGGRDGEEFFERGRVQFHFSLSIDLGEGKASCWRTIIRPGEKLFKTSHGKKRGEEHHLNLSMLSGGGQGTFSSSKQAPHHKAGRIQSVNTFKTLGDLTKGGEKGIGGNNWMWKMLAGVEELPG